MLREEVALYVSNVPRIVRMCWRIEKKKDIKFRCGFRRESWKWLHNLLITCMGRQSTCSCLSTCFVLRDRKSQGMTDYFLDLHRSRSYLEISVRNCSIFRFSVGVFCCHEKKLGTLIGRWQLGRWILLEEEDLR